MALTLAAMLAFTSLSTPPGKAVNPVRAVDPVAQVRNRAEAAAARMREGDALLKAGDLSAACVAYQDTIKLLPTWWMPHLAVVRCGRIVGLPLDDLLTHARFAAKARPRIPVTHAQLGLVLEEAKRNKEAIAAYRAALKAHDGMTEIHYRLGLLLAKQGKARKALPHLERVVRLVDDHVVAWTHLSQVYQKLGLRKKAEAALRRLVEQSRFPALASSRLIRFLQRHGSRAAVRRERARHLREFGVPSTP